MLYKLEQSCQRLISLVFQHKESTKPQTVLPESCRKNGGWQERVYINVFNQQGIFKEFKLCIYLNRLFKRAVLGSW